MGRMSEQSIEALADEQRTFPPSEAFKAQALVRDTSLYDEADEDDEGFWARQAAELVELVEPWDTDPRLAAPVRQVVRRRHSSTSPTTASTATSTPATATRSPSTGRASRATPARSPTPTCSTRCSSSPTCSRGSASRRATGSTIYLPMIPEAAVAMLACARIGAAAQRRVRWVLAPVAGRPHQRRRGQGARSPPTAATAAARSFPLKPAADEAVDKTPTHRARRRRASVAATTSTMVEGRDHWYHELMDGARPTAPPSRWTPKTCCSCSTPSGTTGKPKGIMHTMGGYLTQATFTHKYVFDLHPETDVYWCTADVGWITGHSYIVYGPLSNGCTQVMYEGVPNYPGNDRFWEIVEKYGVTKFYTAPTAIRTFMKWGAEEPAKHDLSSLQAARHGRRADQPRGLDVVPRAHRRRELPDRRHLVADRDRRHHDQPAARRDHHQAGFGDVPAARCVGRAGRRRRRTASTVGGGYLTLTRPWPGMLRGIWGDPERYEDTYWSRFPGRYFAGDGAKLDDDGYLWLLGRVDDVMNVSGHRISTTEVESALVSHPAVAEAAVVGANDATTGQAVFAYVILAAAPTSASPSCATTSPARSVRSPSRRRSSSRPTCPRPAPARSCAGCCATSPRAATSVTRRRLPTRPSSTSCSGGPRTAVARQ